MNGNPAKVFELTLGKKPQIQTGVSCARDCVCCYWNFFSPCTNIFEEKKSNCDEDKKLKVTDYACRQNTIKGSEAGQGLHFKKSMMFCLIPFFGLSFCSLEKLTSLNQNISIVSSVVPAPRAK